MTVDFAFRRAPAYRVASIGWKGPWNETKIRKNFARVAAWAKANRLRTGKWIFREPGARAWEVAIEVRGAAKSHGPVRLKTYPTSTVASVTFDPDLVSPRVVYHGVTDWLRWRKRDKEIRSVGQYREVYDDDPWRNPKAWARTTVQVVVRR